MIEQLTEAGMLLAVGMSVVFAFLTMLIGGIHLIAWFARKYPEAPAITHNNNNRSSTTTVSASQSNTNNNSNEIVAAISAALHIHRNK